MRELLAKIRKSGLACLSKKKEFFLASWSDEEIYDAYERVPVLVAKTRKDLIAFKKAYDTEDHDELGRLYGFPETAIKAFIGKDGFTRFKVDEEPEEIRNQADGYRHLLAFVFSRQNWRNELEQIRNRFRLLSEKAPHLIREEIEEERKTPLLSVVVRELTEEEEREFEAQEKRLRARLHKK